MNKISLAVALLCNLAIAIEPNPPKWNTEVVKIFYPG